MIEWVSEEQAAELKLSTERGSSSSEVCPFCSKVFTSHNGLTAHLRWHPDEVENMVYEVIAQSSRPIRLSTIQRLTGANFSVKNAVQRLNRNGRVFRVSEGFTTHLTTAPVREPVKGSPSVELPTIVSDALSEEQMNKLIVANLKRLRPEIYNSVVNEIVEGMVRYAIGMAEIS